MRWVRRRRRTIMLLLGIAALVAMTFGFLKRIGIDPLSPPDEAREER